MVCIMTRQRSSVDSFLEELHSCMVQRRRETQIGRKEEKKAPAIFSRYSMS